MTTVNSFNATAPAWVAVTPDAVMRTPTLDALHSAKSYENISRACEMAYVAREALKAQSVPTIYGEHWLALEEACAVYVMACLAGEPSKEPT